MKKILFLTFVSAFILSSCSNDGVSEPEYKSPWDVYLLNEGSWGKNDASISALNLTTNTLSSDIYYNSNNKYLGDVAQSIVYGDNHCLYVAVSESKYIAKLDANGKELMRYQTTDKENQPRCLLLKDGSLYASFYGTDTDGGLVAKLDTANLSVSSRVKVGSYPEEIAEINGTIAVCNSGYGYSNTLSMIDIKSMSIKNEVVLPHLNPQDIVTCNGKFYCNTTEYDEYWNAVSTIVEVDPSSYATKNIAEAFIMAPVGNKLYLAKTVTNYYTTPYSYDNTFSVYDTSTGKLSNEFISSKLAETLKDKGIYSMIASPDNSEFYIMVNNQEGTNYVNSDVYVCTIDGQVKQTIKTGVLTSKIAFAQ